MKWLHEDDMSVNMEALLEACISLPIYDIVMGVLDDGGLDRVPAQEMAYLLGAAVMNHAARVDSTDCECQQLERHLLDADTIQILPDDPAMREAVTASSRFSLNLSGLEDESELPYLAENRERAEDLGDDNIASANIDDRDGTGGTAIADEAVGEAD